MEPKRLSAQLLIEWPQSAEFDGHRYMRTASSQIDWPPRLEQLRSLDLSAKNARANAAQLLAGCGFEPAVDEKRRHWTSGSIDDALLDRLRSLQETVRALDNDATRKAAASHCAAYEQAAAQHRSHGAKLGTKSRTLDITALQTAMITYLRQQRADVPAEEGPKLLPALFEAVAYAAKKSGESFQHIMRRITKSTPLPEVKMPEPPYPREVLRNLLLQVSSSIETRLTFDNDGLPIVVLTPLDPVAALLLKAHETRLPAKAWAVCKWCGEQFEQQRRDQKSCSQRCKNNLKMSRQRARKKGKGRTRNA